MYAKNCIIFAHSCIGQLETGKVAKVDLPKGTVHLVIEGFGGIIFRNQPSAYDGVKGLIHEVTGQEVLSSVSQRWGGGSHTDVNHREYATPGAIIRQVRHIRSSLLAAGYRDRPIFIHAHSLGGLIAVSLALISRRDLKIVGLNLMNTAGFDRLGLRRALWHVGVKRTIADFNTLLKALAGLALYKNGRALHRSTAAAIIKYYMGMPLYVLANPLRAIAEAKATTWDIRLTLSGLVDSFPIFIGLSSDDEVFDPGVTKVALDVYGIRNVKFYHTPGRHDPEYFAPGLIEAMRDTGIL